MSRHVSIRHAWLASAGLVSLGLLVSCVQADRLTSRAGDSSEIPAASASDPYPGVNSVAKDRDTWQELLGSHAAIRRTILHSERGVEAVTESDDPAVAAKIIEHAKAMQARMKVGAQVRVWDGVFAELFKRHGAVSVEVTPLTKGVRITESGADPESLALLRSHAMGVSDFVREGFEASARQTPRFVAGDTLPAAELAIGGVRHRFLLDAPDAARLSGLRAAGAGVVMDFRASTEQSFFDVRAAAADTGMTWRDFAHHDASGLVDKFIDSARAAFKAADEKGDVVVVLCSSGGGAGPAWAAYRVLDRAVPLEQAVSEARAMRMSDPLVEANIREYIRRVLTDGVGKASAVVK